MKYIYEEIVTSRFACIFLYLFLLQLFFYSTKYLRAYSKYLTRQNLMSIIFVYFHVPSVRFTARRKQNINRDVMINSRF